MRGDQTPEPDFIVRRQGILEHGQFGHGIAELAGLVVQQHGKDRQRRNTGFLCDPTEKLHGLGLHGCRVAALLHVTVDDRTASLVDAGRPAPSVHRLLDLLIEPLQSCADGHVAPLGRADGISFREVACQGTQQIAPLVCLLGEQLRLAGLVVRGGDTLPDKREELSSRHCIAQDIEHLECVVPLQDVVLHLEQSGSLGRLLIGQACQRSECRHRVVAVCRT